jgi:putative ABC transport system substrate-binding protein
MRKETFFPKSLLLVMALLAITLSFVWSCQQPEVEKKNYLIGIINPNTGSQDINKGFIQELKENGFVEGENTTFLRYDSNFEMDEVIHDMVARNVDLIFTVTTPATRKAKKATLGKNIPVIYAMQDPVASGIINSLAHPNGNLTGVQIRGSVPKTIEWMLEVSPDIKHLFVPLKYDTKAARQSLEDLQKTVTPLGIELSLVEVNDQSELDAALAAIPEEADGIFILCSIFIHSNIEKLVRAARKNKLLIGSGAAQSDRGVTISYGMIAEKTGRQAGRLANLILQGRNPSDIPSEITDFFIGVNLQTAQATDIEIPTDVLQQADIIIR